MEATDGWRDGTRTDVYLWSQYRVSWGLTMCRRDGYGLRRETSTMLQSLIAGSRAPIAHCCSQA